MNIQILENKTAIITGAAKGIGKAIAELFATEGAAVVLTDIDKEELEKTTAGIKAAGGKAIAITADATSLTSCQEVFAKAIAEFGQVDIVINNAGIGDTSTVEYTTDEKWDEIMDINAKATFYYCREAAKHMLPRNSGVIINVSSVNGLRPVSGFAYGASKGAVVNMTRNLAMRFAGTGIRCNCLCPGLTTTPMTDAFLAGSLSGSDPVSMKDFGRKHYVNTDIPALEAIDQAYAALFLASDFARYITGVLLPVERGAYICL